MLRTLMNLSQLLGVPAVKVYHTRLYRALDQLLPQSRSPGKRKSHLGAIRIADRRRPEEDRGQLRKEETISREYRRTRGTFGTSQLARWPVGTGPTTSEPKECTALGIARTQRESDCSCLDITSRRRSAATLSRVVRQRPAGVS